MKTKHVKIILGLVILMNVVSNGFSDFLSIVFSIENNLWIRILLGFYGGMLYQSGLKSEEN